MQSGTTHDMGSRLFAVDILLHDTILEDTDCGQNIQGIFITRIDTIENHAHHNLLPRRATLVPELGLLEIYDLADVLHNTMKGTRGQLLVFVVIGDGDQQLGVSVVHGGTKIVPILKSEVVGITRCRGI